MLTERYHRLEQICRQASVAILYVFGSRSNDVCTWLTSQRDKLAPGPSDVDIGALIDPNQNWSVVETVQLAQALEDLLAVSRVDLVILNHADPFVAANIVRGERLFAADPYQADEYDLFVLRRAGDLVPLERDRMDLILRRDA